MKKYLLIPFLAMIFGATGAMAQDKGSSEYDYCNCIAKYSCVKHADEYNTSDYKCYKAWKKEMKRKKKECQAKILEQDRPMAARRKRREANRKEWKRDTRQQEHLEQGKAHDFWY